MDKLKQTEKFKIWEPVEKRGKVLTRESIEDLERFLKDFVVWNEKNWSELVKRINWLLDRANGYYGAIYAHTVADDIDLDEQDTFYQITSFDNNTVYNGVTPDHTNNHITIDKSGDYKISLSLSGHSHASHNYDIHVKKNDGGTDYDEIAIHQNTAVAGRVVSSSTHSVIALSEDDTVEVWIQRLDGGGTTKTFTVDHINLCIERIGEG